MTPDFTARYAHEALERGLYVLAEGGRRVPIAPVREPTISDLAAEGADAHLLLQAAARAAGRLAPEELGALSPFERACLLRRRERGGALRLCTARVDFMGGMALELNATIPAMQGYADIVAEAYLRASGAPDLIAANGSNTDDLLLALREVQPDLRSLGILARPADAQTGELQHYVARFAAQGVRARIVHPAGVRLRGGRLSDPEGPLDLVYRHLFSWRIEPESDLGRAFLDAEAHGIINPMALDLEAKATLGELSRAADAGEAWLPPDERAAVQRRVPWTRRLDADVAAEVLAEPRRFVLKRSWDYGGRAVHLGIDTPAPRWRELVREALRPGDVWVAQALVEVETTPRTLLHPGAPAAPQPCYADLCAFATLGLVTRARGGASRVAPRRVVNLLSGGGLAPILRPAVAAALDHRG